MRSIPFIFMLAVVLLSCNSGTEPSVDVAEAIPEAFNSNAFILSEVAGSTIKKAERRDGNGTLLEEGFIQDGKKTGTWVTFHPGSIIPKTIVNYVNDKYNGIFMEFNDRGYLEVRAAYVNNLLDGVWAKYKFGRPTNEAVYKEGKLNGVYREYVMNTGKLQKEITYRDGMMDGPYRFYNEEGAVTVEYEYSKGQKISGGMVNASE